MEDSNISNLFKSLESHIEKQEFDEAIGLLKANYEKFDSGVYHYNLASIYAQKQELVKSRIHYEEAMNNGYVSPELKASLRKVRESLDIVEAEKPENTLDYLHYSVIETPIQMFVTVLLLTLILIIVGMKKTSGAVKVILSLLIMLPGIIGYIYYSKTEVVILQQDKIVRSGPSKIFEEVHVMPKGMKVLMGRSYSDFLEVVYPSTYKGWVEKNGYYHLRK